MPLLNKQKFTKKPLPKELDPDQEVFYSKLTQEIFLDYEEFFERTILCNSLVWTCCLTGKTGLTYAEAVESEQKARKSMSTFPYVLEKAIVYLINLTKRGNIKDLIDDVFGYAKDRYFIGEILQVVGQKHQTCKIIDVLIPQSALSEQQQQASSSFEESIDVELDQSTSQSKKPQSAATNGLLVDAAKIKYLVEIESKLNGQSTRQTLKSSQLVRFKNQLTKDKIYIIIKTNCDVVQSVWTITEKAHVKFNLNDTKFSELFKGDPPCFQTTYGRGQFSRTSLNNSKLNKSLTNTSISSSNGKQKQSVSNSKSSNKQSSSSAMSSPQKKSKKPEGKLAQILNKKISDMSSDEFKTWRDNKKEDDLRELELIEYEADKLFKKEEKEKEKERLKAEKNKQKEYLKELKKPKEDLECDNLVELPQPTPIQSKITQSMFGDSLMLLEFLNYFGDLFDLRADFPTGFNFELLENALFSKSCDSALCNLLLFYLDSVFKCYDEETFDADAAATDTDDVDNDDMDLSDDEEITLEQLYKEPASQASDRESFSSLAESYSKLIKSIQGRQYKSIGLDVYTISEMLRLYFLTSGSSHHSKTKFWYQQRGGYTRMDEIGIDFSLNEKSILKKLETMNVYELDPEDKLKILTSLCNQLMSQVRLRDLIEDNWCKLTSLRAQLRDLQTEENRRLREEQSERWKKKLQDKAKEKARLEEIKTNVQKSTSNTNKKDEDDIETAKQLQYSNRKREEFLKKEKHILDEINQLQAKCCMSSIGKDRYYRRYWVVKSMPGVYVEDTNDYDELNFILNGELKSDVEIKNESIDETTSHKENTPNGCTVLARANGVKKTSSRHETKWSFYYTPSQIDSLIESLNERGIRESELKQNLIEVKEKICDVLTKTTLVKNLTMSKEEIEKGIQESIKENMNNVLVNIINNNSLNNTQKTKRQVLKMANSALSTAPNFATVLSREYLESELRTKLLDIEEQIFVGSLGSLKVVDRLKWKQELEKLGSYDPQCATLSWGGSEFSRPASEYTIDVMKVEHDELEHLKTVNNLAKALLQIEQSVEKRFLRTPIGECQKTPEKQRRKPAKQANGFDANHNENSNDSITSSAQHNKYQILHNWEKSLMNCTTLSQIFIHLQSLDESIAWSKSALNAKCRLCKKKCDAEKMLLCDKCDRGHHLYCLRPPLKEIPSGDWFCPECKPKDAEKTPRKMRKSFAREDIYSDENEENGDADESDAEDEDNEDEDDDDENEEEEEEDENETSNENSDDSHVNDKGKKNVRANTRKRKKEETESEESDDEGDNDEENEENEEEEEVDDDENEISVEENEDEEGEEDKEEDDSAGDDDEDYVEAIGNKSKIKMNGFKKNNKKSHHHVVSEEDEEVNIDEDTADETTDSRRGRKRKATITNKKETKSTKLVSKTTTKVTNRNSRTRVNYNELSEDVSGTDEDAKVSTKRIKIQSNKSAVSNNDTSSRNTELAHRLKVIEKLLNDMMKHTDGWPFLKPVSKRDAPDYYEIIERPMDFATIKNNINNFKYDDYTNIIDDIRLTFENCWEYNEPGSEIYRTGKRLSAYFESHAKQAGLLDYKS